MVWVGGRGVCAHDFLHMVPLIPPPPPLLHPSPPSTSRHYRIKNNISSLEGADGATLVKLLAQQMAFELSMKSRIESRTKNFKIRSKKIAKWEEKNARGDVGIGDAMIIATIAPLPPPQ